MPRIQAVVFDVDGTIINTFEHIVRAFEIVLPQHGVKPDREEIRAVIGLTLIDCYKALVPEGDHEAMRKLHHQTQQTSEMYELITEYEGLREACDKLKQKGLKLAIQTNRSRDSINLIFTHLGLNDIFDIIITPETVSKPKPDPEGLQVLAEKLEIDVSQMVMVGDTTIDVQAGKNAGLGATISLTHGFGSLTELKAAQPTKILESLHDLPEAISQL